MSCKYEHPKDADMSPHSALLGSRFVSFDEETSTATMHFTVRPEVITHRGGVQGGLVAGYLDDVMGYAYVAATGGQMAPLNLEISMSLIRLIPEGPLIGKGRVVKGGRKVVILEGELFSEDGKLMASRHRIQTSPVPGPMQP